jgi:lysophospholipid acyltransferase (LPLAT)-like uncharacterized protein
MRLRGFPLKLVLWLGPLIYLGYMRFVFFTSRKKIEGLDRLFDTLDRGETALAAAWHQDAIIGPYIFRKRNMHTMASLSRDGELLARAFGRFGFTVFRGSTSRRGKGAIRELAEHLKSRGATFCVLAADGPKGPVYEVKKGIVFLAKQTGAPIFPVRAGAKRRKLNKSWDHTTIPLPFNSLVYLCGEPVSVSSTAGKDEIEAARVEVENRLNELTNRIERYFGREQET